MTREEANARLAALQELIHKSIVEAEQLAEEHELQFTIRGGPQLDAQSHRDITFRVEVDEWDDERYVYKRYTGQWVSSYC